MAGKTYEESWNIRFTELGYCNCQCHNDSHREETHHVWGDCYCYHPGKIYHDDGVLLAHPIRLLPFADTIKPQGEIQASLILQSSFSRHPIQSNWYTRLLQFLVETFTPGRR